MEEQDLWVSLDREKEFQFQWSSKDRQAGFVSENRFLGF
jgi:hypothetical protein